MRGFHGKCKRYLRRKGLVRVYRGERDGYSVHDSFHTQRKETELRRNLSNGKLLAIF